MWARATALHALIAFLLVAPLLPARVLVTGDLHNHVRHVHEAGLALAQGQLPPLVAPQLNDQRLRLFQLYSGTAFLLPGALTFATDAYTAFRLSIFLASLAAALALRALLLQLFPDEAAALVGAVAFQLASFPTHDLLKRGSLTEWLALQLAVLALAAATRLMVASAPAWPFALTVAALALFLPCHPLQTVLLGATGAGLLLLHAADLRRQGGRPRLDLPLVAGLCGLGSCAWFWLPILRHWGALKMTTWRGASAWVSAYTSLDVLLWPWARGVEPAPAWTPQLGAPLALGLLLATLAGAWRHGRVLAGAALGGWALLLLTASPPWLNHRHPWLVSLLGLNRLQYSYRLLLPATLLASVCLAWSWSWLRRRAGWRPAWVTTVAVAGVVLHALPYVWGTSASARRYALSLDELLAPTFEAPNSSFYGLVGADYRRLGWTGPRGLRLREELPLPQAGLPFEARLETPLPLAELRGEAEGRALVVARRLEADLAAYEFAVTPSRTFRIRFEGPAALDVAALRFKPQGDTRWLALPSRVDVLATSGTAWRARVTAERAGPVQLPVAYFPGDRVTVDGHPAPQASQDRFLVVAELRAGANLVEVETVRDGWASLVVGLSLVACLALVAALPR